RGPAVRAALRDAVRLEWAPGDGGGEEHRAHGHTGAALRVGGSKHGSSAYEQSTAPSRLASEAMARSYLATSTRASSVARPKVASRCWAATMGCSRRTSAASERVARPARPSVKRTRASPGAMEDVSRPMRGF